MLKLIEYLLCKDDSYIIFQIYDMSANDNINLVNHLGHSMKVHKVKYRQTDWIGFV